MVNTFKIVNMVWVFLENCFIEKKLFERNKRSHKNSGKVMVEL